MSRYSGQAYLSPSSGIDDRGVSDMPERVRAARDGSNRLLAAMLRYYERRRAA
ncbi:hypothetical protein TomTYG75_07000 [Sphingobium sp. TomTYG75]